MIQKPNDTTRALITNECKIVRLMDTLRGVRHDAAIVKLVARDVR